MEKPDNPVFYALLSGDSHRSSGTEQVKYFDIEVSPFVGFEEGYRDGFNDLHDLLPPGRRILYATRKRVTEPPGWKLAHEIEGLQFLYPSGSKPPKSNIVPEQLNETHVEEMIELARLTKPGPFDKRTIEFGHYYGVFENGRLAAMTGQRLHPSPYSEVSAVCTHPDFTGKGYAKALLNQQVGLILKQGAIPFLHVRADNERAIDLYVKNGFVMNEEMNFYFMKRI